MEKPLLKITFTKPFYVYQEINLMVLTSFVLTRNLERNKYFVKIKDYKIPQSFSFNFIKSIEFIKPTDL